MTHEWVVSSPVPLGHKLATTSVDQNISAYNSIATLMYPRRPVVLTPPRGTGHSTYDTIRCVHRVYIYYVHTYIYVDTYVAGPAS